MTQEQRDILMRELSDLKNRKVFNIGDAMLLHSESICVPYEQVKEMYETCKLIGMNKTCKKYNKGRKTITMHFHKYNFPPVGKTYTLYENEAIRKKQTKSLTQKYQDSLTLGFNEWKLKYNVKSNANYYRHKKIAEKFLSNETL
jgi:hypothetical protein